MRHHPPTIILNHNFTNKLDKLKGAANAPSTTNTHTQPKPYSPVMLAKMKGASPAPSFTNSLSQSLKPR